MPTVRIPNHRRLAAPARRRCQLTVIPARGVVLIDQAPPLARFIDEAVIGLGASPKAISPKWFYDALGSKLFDAICDLPEYYPTRTEMKLFSDHAPDMAQRAGIDRVLIELGSGNGEKVRRLMSHLRPRAYVGVDISKEILHSATTKLKDEYPGLSVYAVCSDFSSGFRAPDELPEASRLYFYPGSSIGNFTPDEAVKLLQPLARPGDALLIGVDLIKDRATLESAYDDALGVTAAFNLNLLARMNRELRANFDLSRFRHIARFDEGLSRIEMHLESTADQAVSLDERTFSFAAGERLHTESSYKYSVEGFAALAARAGWTLVECWTDERCRFAEMLFEA
jgi:dimethylhistidine N-methyltransferase